MNFLKRYMNCTDLYMSCTVLCTVSGPEDLHVYVTENPDLGSKHKFICALCNQSGLNRRDLRNHVESIHFPGTFTYSCDICDKELKTKKALNNHKYTQHKDPFQHLMLS